MGQGCFCGRWGGSLAHSSAFVGEVTQCHNTTARGQRSMHLLQTCFQIDYVYFFNRCFCPNRHTGEDQRAGQAVAGAPGVKGLDQRIRGDLGLPVVYLNVPLYRTATLQPRDVQQCTSVVQTAGGSVVVMLQWQDCTGCLLLARHTTWGHWQVKDTSGRKR